MDAIQTFATAALASLTQINTAIAAIQAAGVGVSAADQASLTQVQTGLASAATALAALVPATPAPASP